MRADTDGDGKITLQELQAIWPGVDEEVFARLDRNNDGVLSAEDRRGKGPEGGKPEKQGRKGPKAGPGPEQAMRGPHAGPGGFGPGPQGPQPQWQMPPAPPAGPPAPPQGFPPQPPRMRLMEKLREADKDGNKEVTFEELSAVVPDLDKAKFDRLDRNGDGVISAADTPKPPEGQGPGPWAGAGPQGPIPPAPGFQGPGPQGVGPMANAPGVGDRRQRLREMFKEADTDGDGKLTFDELSAKFPRMDQERFKRWDRNQDGVISPEDRGAPPEPPRDNQEQ